MLEARIAAKIFILQHSPFYATQYAAHVFSQDGIFDRVPPFLLMTIFQNARK